MGRPRLTFDQQQASIARQKEQWKIWNRANRDKITIKSKKWADANKDKVAASSKLYRATHPTASRAAALLCQFGITLDEWNTHFVKQGFRCDVCGRDNSGSKHGWCTDHDHNKNKGDPGFFRGILCHHCNIVLGHVQDSPAHLRQLLTYLEKSHG